MRNEAIIVSSEKFRGDLYIVSTGNIKLVGAEGRKSSRIPLEVDLPKDSRVKRAFLEISATTSEDPSYVRWRLWLDNLQLAREFKPLMSKSLGDEKFYSKIIYDITPVFNCSQRVHYVNVMYEGFRGLSIDHLSLVVPYETEDAETTYTYISTPKVLNLGEKFRAEFSLPGLESEDTGELKISCIFPSKAAKVSVSLNGELIEVLGGICNLGELEFSQVTYKPGTNVLELSHESKEVNYYPRHFKLSHLLFKVSKYKLPKLRIEKVSLEGRRVRVKIVNEGESCPDKAIVMLMATGEVYGREILELKHRRAEVELPISKSIKPGSKVILRVIWRKLNQTHAIDRELTF